jgi:hypothetical protein
LSIFQPKVIKHVKILRHGEYIVAAISKHKKNIINDLLEFENFFYVLTAADTDLPVDWINITYQQQDISYKLGKHACLIYPTYAQKALESTLVGGDAFYICNEQPRSESLDQESYGCLADYSVYPDDRSIPNDVILKAICEIEKFNAIYHVSDGFGGVLLVVTNDELFNQVLEKYFGDISRFMI